MEKGWCPTATNSGNRAQVAPMAAFLLAVFGQLVTASGWEWCKSAHTVVISVARTLLKSGLRAPWSKYHLPRFCHTHVSDRPCISDLEFTRRGRSAFYGFGIFVVTTNFG